MYSKFLEGMTGKVSEQWVTNLLTPAFVFWLGGLAASIYHFGWTPLKTWALQQPQPVQVGLLIVGLIVIVTSSSVAQKFDRPMLRFLEGYWPRWMKPLRHKRTQRYVNQWQQQQQRWSTLYAKGEAALSAEELNEYAQLDWLVMHSPSQPNQFMPTRLGNLLRASEYRSKERYGLDAVVCWPRLWLLLPDSTRKELQEARAALNTTVRISFWSLLFLVWTPLAWWAPLLALPVAWFSYRIALSAAAVYVDLLEATFDVHRHLLYQSLRIKLPKNPIKEAEDGKKLTQYLWREPDPTMPDFHDPPKS
ncbi:hypothetical protein [Leptothoe sp. PORK10 BA2]|uniref:hypothetical protein n=1 Tax=Leptothoe sp. PORK10 BA2 TaxID=3110254 RepID=UPI002B20A876|nr:hypothetical protein [Leptothoe sp. PORK10 BA2]MEA5467120.1 hypothetical protein [Leptothoe sp. PORK10 BA2]